MFPLKFCRSMWRLYSRKFFFFVTTALILYTLLKHYSPNKDNGSLSPLAQVTSSEVLIIPIDMDDVVEPYPLNSLESLLSSRDCPLCLGQHSCQDLRQSLKLDEAQPLSTEQHKIVHKALWKTSESVIIKTVPSSDIVLLQRRLCQLAKLPIRCKSHALVDPEVKQESVKISSGNIKEIVDHLRENSVDVPFSLCITEKLFTILEKIFHEKDDTNITFSEHLMLISNLALTPEALALKFFKSTNMDIPVLQLYGSCGRAIVLEGGLTPLKEFLREPFDVRAALAAKLLQIVGDFLEEDPDWSVMFSGFGYDNLAVDKNGEVVLLDISDVVIIDKNEYQSKREINDISNEPCNQECFSKFKQFVLTSTNQRETCESIAKHSNLMYAIVCQQVLSNLDEHRVENYFHLENASIMQAKLENPGLLHGLPDKDRDAVEELLRECVTETEEGGRLQAAEELHALLSDYTSQELDYSDDNNDANEYDDT